MRTVVHLGVRSIWADRLSGDEAIDRFFQADAQAIPAPSALPGLMDAADRIETAINTNDRIAIFGHDDPDGITSCAILVEALEMRGARPLPYIPDRNVEGHGLYPDLIRRFADRGVRLLLTTDGCTANAEEVHLAESLGMDVYVTDHHVLAEGRTAVPHLVNPMADPVTAERYGDLTGAGVAAWLARELLDRGGAATRFGTLFDLVALGTIADYGDVGNNNRPMLVGGLQACARGDRAAVDDAMRRLAIRDPFAEKDARRLAGVFAAIPSLHGESRGLAALLGRDGWRQDVIALTDAYVTAEDKVRRAVADGRECAEREGILDGAPALLRMDDLEKRFLGAVAGALMRETGRPAAVMAVHDGTLVAELRGPEHVHLVDILGEVRERLSSWGGHRRAAGFSADGAHTESLTADLRERLDVAPAPADAGHADLEITREDVTTEFLDSLAATRPWGKGNRAPVLRIGGKLVSGDDLLGGEPS